jgi:hypothetical protein
MRFSNKGTLIFLILLLLFAVSVSACGDDEVETTVDDSSYDYADDDGSRSDTIDTGDHETSAAISTDEYFPRDFTLSLPLFAAGSAWNQSVENAAVLPESDEQMLVLYRVLLGDMTDLTDTGMDSPWPFMVINFDDYSIPIFRAGTEEAEVGLCEYEGARSWPGPKFENQEEGGPVSLPQPAVTVRPSNPVSHESDGHLVLVDPDSLMEYDFWQATTVRSRACDSEGSGIPGTRILEAGAVDFFDISGDALNPDGVSSARASGTPLLAGVLLPEDIASGSIDHALALAIPGTRNTGSDPEEPPAGDYFYPVATTEAQHFNTNPLALASGQRLRLKQNLVDVEGSPLDTTGLAPVTRMYLKALQKHGAIIVDNAGGFIFYAEDIHTGVIDLSEDEVNGLIGKPAGTPIPNGATPWQVVLDQLLLDLEYLPVAYGEWDEDTDPLSATMSVSNFEVVEPATRP